MFFNGFSVLGFHNHFVIFVGRCFLPLRHLRVEQHDDSFGTGLNVFCVVLMSFTAKAL